MPTLTITYSTEAERLAYERAIAFVAELHRLGQEAPAGQVLDACEGLALDRGRELLRNAVAGAVQARIDTAEKKGALRASAPADTKATTREGDHARS